MTDPRLERLATQNDLLRERADDAETRMLRRDRQIEHLTAQLAKARGRMDELAGPNYPLHFCRG
jgi:hypothetical protein